MSDTEHEPARAINEALDRADEIERADAEEDFIEEAHRIEAAMKNSQAKNNQH